MDDNCWSVRYLWDLSIEYNLEIKRERERGREV